MVRLDRTPSLEPLYGDAAACLCDGRIVRGLSRLAGSALPLVSGSDLVRALFDTVIAPGDKVCLVGGSAATAQGLERMRPDVIIEQLIPPMNLGRDASARRAVVAFVRRSRARFVLLAVGSPQQEMVAHELRGAVGITGTALCIGGAAEYLAGTKKRAPLAVQRAGLEFVWRIAEDPGRLWKRYLLDGPAIIPIFCRWWLNDRKRRG
ncbi:MAG TPA: WecB/TagA/CpsF family glycosyltransferase [Sphingomonas sp.]|jgi:exopolysaccharide biosynthesis WecB/TagA/CpsF family protein|nr:WecB/TagA/CpsF family glycosyltransferase [Sphingomonas sp.]